MTIKNHNQNLEALQFAVLSSTLLLLLRTRTQAVRSTSKEVFTVTSDHSWFGLKSKGCLFLNCTFTSRAFVLRRKIEYFKVHLGISNLIWLSGIKFSFSLVMVNANSSPAQKVFKSTMANNIINSTTATTVNVRVKILSKWSSGNGSRFTLKRSWVRIPADDTRRIIFHVKLYWWFKRKRGRWLMAHFY